MWVVFYYSNRAIMHCYEISFQELLDSYDHDFENDPDNNVWNLEHTVLVTSMSPLSVGIAACTVKEL